MLTLICDPERFERNESTTSAEAKAAEEDDENVATTHREQPKAKSEDTGKTFDKIDDAFADLENFDL